MVSFSFTDFFPFIDLNLSYLDFSFMFGLTLIYEVRFPLPVKLGSSNTLTGNPWHMPTVFICNIIRIRYEYSP